MSFFVYRECEQNGLVNGRSEHRVGWVGPIDTEPQANREADAWRSCGWIAEVRPNSPAVRTQVRAWMNGGDAPFDRLDGRLVVAYIDGGGCKRCPACAIDYDGSHGEQDPQDVYACLDGPACDICGALIDEIITVARRAGR